MSDKTPEQTNYEVIIYYKYEPVRNPEGFVLWHKDLCGKLGMTGRILIANEGINGTAEGTTEAVDAYKKAFYANDGSEGTFGNFSDVWFKSTKNTSGTSFPKLKVKYRKEIVALGLTDSEGKDVDPRVDTGKYLSADELHQWYENGEDFEIIDMRNSWEFMVGHFKNSIDPEMKYFRELPKKIEKLEHLKKKKVLTVCTSGVRCEKASAYLKAKGFEDVYQLHGGQQTYMQKYPGKNFLGSLYVFDNRITMETAPINAREVVGKCVKCQDPCEKYTNCFNDECHAHLICCDACQDKHDHKVFCGDGECKIRLTVSV